jgi:Siphovirus-type tail component, C-terminal domain
MTDAWIPDDLCETHEWRSGAGEVVRFVTRTGAQARMMPPVSLDLLRVPQAHGARFRGARHEPRLVLLPVVAPAPQTVAGRDELRRWARALDPAAGEGTLTVVDGPSPGRYLVCAYEAGLETLTEEYGQPLELAVIGFRAGDPYWHDAGVITRDLPIVEPSATTVVTNTGDVDAWPVFTLTGPATSIWIINDTTGLKIGIGGAPFVAGDVIVVDTRPGHKTITINGTGDGFSRLTSDSTFWPLIPGDNSVTVNFTGSTVASTSAFDWSTRWLSA